MAGGSPAAKNWRHAEKCWLVAGAAADAWGAGAAGPGVAEVEGEEVLLKQALNKAAPKADATTARALRAENF
jgi:hypothetical protein